MPNLKSAKKRTRQSEKRNEQNSNKKSAIRTAEKKLRKQVAEKKFPEAEKTHSVLSKLIDRASKTNLVHKNAADRKKSRLALLINKAKSA